MNITTLKETEVYLQNKQVYFRMEIADRNLKTIADAGRVHNVGKVELDKVRDDTIALRMVVNGNEVNIYEHRTELGICAWIKKNFIPVQALIERYNEL